MHNIPYIFNKLDLNNLIFIPNICKPNKKIILIKYNDNNKINNCVFQLPTLINDHNIENNNFEINLKCYNKNNTNKLIQFFNNLDNKIISESKQNIMWFTNLKNKSQLKYKKIIKDTSDCDSGCINFKLIKCSDFTTQIYLNKNIYNDLLPSNGTCQIILECYGILINNDTCNFELILRPIVLSFKLSYNYNLVDSEDNLSINESDNNISDNNILDNNSLDNKTSDNENSDNENSDNKLFIKL